MPNFIKIGDSELGMFPRKNVYETWMKIYQLHVRILVEEVTLVIYFYVTLYIYIYTVFVSCLKFRL